MIFAPPPRDPIFSPLAFLLSSLVCFFVFAKVEAAATLTSYVRYIHPRPSPPGSVTLTPVLPSTHTHTHATGSRCVALACSHPLVHLLSSGLALRAPLSPFFVVRVAPCTRLALYSTSASPSPLPRRRLFSRLLLSPPPLSHLFAASLRSRRTSRGASCSPNTRVHGVHPGLATPCSRLLFFPPPRGAPTPTPTPCESTRHRRKPTRVRRVRKKQQHVQLVETRTSFEHLFTGNPPST